MLKFMFIFVLSSKAMNINVDKNKYQLFEWGIIQFFLLGQMKHTSVSNKDHYDNTGFGLIAQQHG